MTFDLLLSKSQQVFLAAPQMVYKKWIVAICEAAREDEGKKKTSNCILEVMKVESLIFVSQG